MDEFRRNTELEGSAYQDGELSLGRYNILIGLHLIYGIFLTALICYTMSGILVNYYGNHPFIFTILFFVVSLGGSSLARRGSYPIALLGYTITVLGFGSLLATVLPFYALPLIGAAAGMTLVVLLTMTLAAVIMPKAFLSMGRTIFIALIGLIVAELLAMLFHVYNYGLFGVLGLFLFSLYIGYDWARGQRCPKTASFAVYTALNLYVDVINIFVRILSLMGRRR